MDFPKINLKYFAICISFFFLLTALHLEDQFINMITTGFAFSIAFIIYGIIGLLAILTVLIITYSLKSVLLWIVWKKVDLPIPDYFLQPPTLNNTLERTDESEIRNMQEYEAKRGGILFSFATYITFIAVKYITGSVNSALLGNIIVGLSAFAISYIGAYIFWWLFIETIIGTIYNKITKKMLKPTYQMFELHEQEIEIDIYEKTLKVLENRIASYGNIGRNEGLIVKTNDQEVMLKFDYKMHTQSTGIGNRTRKQSYWTYDFEGYFRNNRKKNGAICWKHQGSERPSKKYSEIEYSPELEAEAQKIYPRMQQLIFDKKVLLEDRNLSFFDPFSIIFKEESVLIRFSLKKDFKQSEILAIYDFVTECKKIFSN